MLKMALPALLISVMLFILGTSLIPLVRNNIGTIKDDQVLHQEATSLFWDNHQLFTQGYGFQAAQQATEIDRMLSM